MDFELTDEQRMLRETARQFVAKVCPAEQAKKWDEESAVPPELFSGMADLGWFSLPFPAEEGGDGGGPVELIVLAEELGRASFDVAMCYIGVLIPGITVFRWGTEPQRDFIRDQVMTGRHRLAVGLSEPDSGSDAAALRTTAEDRGDHFVVRGQKAWCTGAGLPDTTIATYVRTGPREPKHSGISLLLIDPESPGVEVRRTPTLARHILGTNEVFFGDVVVPKENLVGPAGEGWKVMLSNIELEKVIITGGYLGAAQATLDEMLEFARTRQAFGRPVGTFQAIAHAIADLQTEIDSARLLAYRAAWLLAQGKPCTREGSMAKLKGSETYVAAARLGMQVCAGHGFSTESVMSFRYRESIVATISGGTSQIQRNGIARSMGLRTY
ncbi:acyl-CoA dehydrogenase [Amycolatopsis balhimycina DSM 5908]|uniref:Acyl-CoA dehydrogenase n=1 Tax=Amycolatopsis balhimycina DSM 5908 TaxID=1081091 RepID=A0A428WVE7_AMYBA|nr:acyl-CoA dehydrogenase family protein [Amycolatopsis balhimycina]RSM47046.1 acyl-CoA dehydrogenase [Amycolatopsis balhimycina DSM 5908]